MLKWKVEKKNKTKQRLDQKKVEKNKNKQKKRKVRLREAKFYKGTQFKSRSEI